MRYYHNFDEAMALESLVSLFLSKKYFPSTQYSYSQFSSHFSILLCLFLLETETDSRQLGEISLKLIRHIYNTSGEKFKWSPPNDLFSNSVLFSPSIKNVSSQDLFCQGLSIGKSNENLNDTRFGFFMPEYQKIKVLESLTLGEFQKPTSHTTWFDYENGELMGAFLHVQNQDPKNPYNINLSLPPLSMNPQVIDFPFPCIPKGTVKNQEKKVKKFTKPWEKISNELMSNNDMFVYEPNRKNKCKLWENNEKKQRIQGVISGLDREYEEILLKTMDSTYKITEKPLSNEEFMRNLKNLILGIPNKLYDFDKKKAKTNFRIEFVSHLVINNFLKEIINVSESYLHLNQLSTVLQNKAELISPAFAKGLKQILAFFENFVINASEKLTIIQFSVQTQSLRNQINSLHIICKDIPSGLKLIDYLYDIIIKNEGDFENYSLLQMLFKNILKPILATLTDFIFNCEINDIYEEFFILYNKDLKNQVDFSLKNYSNSYKALPSLLFDSISNELVNIGKNMRILKFLEEDLSCYYQILSTATLTSSEMSNISLPKFKISYDTEKIQQISDSFIVFQAEQTQRLLELEKKEIESEINQSVIEKQKKIQSVHNLKLISSQKLKLDQEKLQEKQRKQWEFYNILDSQLKENRELKRIEEEKRKKEEITKNEKIDQEQKDLIEKGKRYLIEQHDQMVAELNWKKVLENWKKKRMELNEKRQEFFRVEEELIKKGFEEMVQLEQSRKLEDLTLLDTNTLGEPEDSDMMNIESVEGLLDNSIKIDGAFDDKESIMLIDKGLLSEFRKLENKSSTDPVRNFRETEKNSEFKAKNEEIPIFSEPYSRNKNSPSNLTEKSFAFPEKIKQPPGGFSTIGELFNYKFEKEPEKIFTSAPRIGFNETLEKFQICSDLLWEEILQKVFRKINAKKHWEIPAKQDEYNLFTDLFENFSEKCEKNKNFSIPFPKIIEKIIMQPIRTQNELVNKSCVHLFLRKLKLLDHLKTLKRYALLEAGDTIDLFLNTLFSNNFTGNMTAAWEGSLKMTSSKDDENSDFFRISIKANNLYRMQFKTVEDLEFLVVHYNVKGPLQLILGPEKIEMYSKAFCSLLRVKHVTSILSNLKMYRVHPRYPYYRKIHLLRQKMQHFLDIYQGYIASELHGSTWKFLTKGISEAKCVEDLVKVHKEYLDLVMTRCFLIGKGTIVMEQLSIIFQLVMRFQNVVLDLDEFSFRDIEMIEQDFNSIHRFLFKMTQTMANKGNYPELFTRLDFNEFMTKKIENEQSANN